MATEVTEAANTTIQGPRMPFTVIVDTREQLEYDFRHIPVRKVDVNLYLKHQFPGKRISDLQQYVGQNLIVPIKHVGLKTGDYSIEGFEDQIAVERKSLADLFGSVGGGRDRFEAEHVRLSEIKHSIVVIESTYDEMIKHPPKLSKMSVEAVNSTRISWDIKYKVPWFFIGSRYYSELFVFRYLEMFYRIQLGIQQGGKDVNSNGKSAG